MTNSYVEIRTLNPDYPVFGRPNGHWEQELLDGSRRSLGKNAAKQALVGTWAIGDKIRGLARTGAVRSSDFKLHIITLVAFWQRIPPGSNIETPAHVNVVSYAGLLDRLTEPGPAIDWNNDESDAFAPDLARPVPIGVRIAGQQAPLCRSRRDHRLPAPGAGQLLDRAPPRCRSAPGGPPAHRVPPLGGAR